MRIIYFLKKCVKEIFRDWKMLILTLIFGPAFVGLFYVLYSNTQTTYKICITNSDIQVANKQNESFSAGNELIKLLKDTKNSDGTNLYKVTLEKDKDKALTELKNKKYDVYVSIPEDFSQSIINQSENPSNSKTKLTIYGDMGSERYIIPAITIGNISEKLVSSITGIPKAINFVEESVESYKNLTDFEATIPAAIFVGIIMLMFTSATALVKEVETGTIRRLQISRVYSWEMLTAVTLSQLLIGVISIALTLFTAMGMLHAKSAGSLTVVCLISFLFCFSIIATGFILAGFSRNVSDILIIGNFPYFLFLLLSGVFPIPRINIFYVGNHSFALSDLLPSTPAVTALKAVMTQGKGLNDVMFEIIMMLVLTVIYFILGIYLFNRKHMGTKGQV